MRIVWEDVLDPRTLLERMAVSHVREQLWPLMIPMSSSSVLRLTNPARMASTTNTFHPKQKVHSRVPLGCLSVENVIPDARTALPLECMSLSVNVFVTLPVNNAKTNVHGITMRTRQTISVSSVRTNVEDAQDPLRVLVLHVETTGYMTTITTPLPGDSIVQQHVQQINHTRYSRIIVKTLTVQKKILLSCPV